MRQATGAAATGAGGNEGGGGGGAATPTSAAVVGMTGNSVSRPLSNSSRHSGPTDCGSRRYCSYMTCTNAALCVPNTNSLTPAI